MENQIKELRGKLDSVTKKYKTALEGVKQLTEVQIFSYLQPDKYPIKETEVGLMFAVNETIFQVITNSLPFLTIRAVYKIDADLAENFAIAAKDISESKHMIKAFVYDDSLIIDLQSYELDCRHFYNSFSTYLRLIEIASGAIFRDI